MAIQRVIRPGVEVQQVFLQTNPTLINPDLPTVVVGPNVQTEDNVAAGAYAKGAEDVVMPYPGLEFASKVKLGSVAVRLTNVVLAIVAKGASTVTFSGDRATLSVSGTEPDFAASGVKAGDVLAASVEVTEDVDGVSVTRTVAYSARVLAVNSATVLTLDRDLDGVAEFAGGAEYEVTRKHGDFMLPADAFEAGADSVKILAGLQVNLGTEATPSMKDVLTADVDLTYRALRQLTANRLTVISSAPEIEAKLMKLSEENPLALGAFLAKGNTVSSVLMMAVEEDTPLGYLKALDLLQNEAIYTIVCLTQDPTVQGMVKTHVDQMSLPEKSRFRMGFINLENPTERQMVDTLEVASLKRETAGSVTTVSVTHPMANFAGVVLPGDYVVATARVAPATSPTADASVAGVYRVLAVKNNSTLVLDDRKYTGEKGVYMPGAAMTTDFTAQSVDLDVIRALDAQGQAEAIGEIAQSYNDRRITYITNAKVVVTIGEADVTVPGYYLAAAYGGMNAGNPPHQGFTNLGVVGIKAVMYGNRYYSDDQLKIIAGGGGFVVTQEVEGALPAAFIQTTTDTSSIQRRELSITKTLDFYSLGLKKILNKFIGTYNIYGATLAALENAVEGYHTFLLSQSYDRIGSPILSGAIRQLVQDELAPDTVRLITDIEIPTPLNYIKATVQVVA